MIGWREEYLINLLLLLEQVMLTTPTCVDSAINQMEIDVSEKITWDDWDSYDVTI